MEIIKQIKDNYKQSVNSIGLVLIYLQNFKKMIYFSYSSIVDYLVIKKEIKMSKVRKISLLIITFITLFIFNNVIVYAVQPQSIRIANNPGKVQASHFFNLDVDFYPKKVDDINIKWTSSDNSILSVKSIPGTSIANVLAGRPGIAQITAEASNGIKTTTTIEVVNFLYGVSNLSIGNNPKIMLVGDKAKLSSNTKKVIWSSDDPNILTVDDKGNITAKGIGRTNINIKNKKGDTTSVSIQVIKMYFDKTELKLNEGETKDISATIEAATTFNPILYSKILWTSDSAVNMKIDGKSSHGEDFDYDIRMGNTSDEDRISFFYKTKITASKKGKSKLTFRVDDVSITTDVNIVGFGEDYSLPCPTIDYDKNDNRSIKIIPGSNIEKWTLYAGYNHGKAENKKWLLVSGYIDVSGEKNVYLNTANSVVTQGKIIVYGKNGGSRVCYTAPLDGLQSIDQKGGMPCPTVKYDLEKESSGINQYSYYSSRGKTTTGVSKMNISFMRNKKYQYLWYTYDGEKKGYVLHKTFAAIEKEANGYIIGQKRYERNVRIGVMDNDGLIGFCDTDYIDNRNLTKYVKTSNGYVKETGSTKRENGTANLYIEAGTNNDLANYVISKMNEYESNADKKMFSPASNVFFLTASTYGEGSCGWALSTNMIANLKDVSNGCPLDYQKGAFVHELGHNVDYMRGRISKDGNWIREQKYSFEDNETMHKNVTIDDVRKNYSNYKKENGDYEYLRDYAYSSRGEFWAEFYAFKDSNYQIDTYLTSFRNKIISDYKDSYKNNKQEFINVKEKYHTN